MALETETDTGRSLAYSAGATALFLSAAAIATALAFQYVGGYVPCPLCSMQRYAYYAAIPALFIALMLVSGGHRGWPVTLFFLVALAFLANAGLGVYHAGAEWKYWPGPASCGTEQALTGSAGNLLKDLEHTTVVRCDEAQWRLFGLSFAGWNVLSSLAIFALALRAAFAVSEPR